jgi:hypothetical protein
LQPRICKVSIIQLSITNPNDTLDTLAGAKWFSTLDLRSGYSQMDLHPDKNKTAFSMGQRLWQFTVMPFDLCNAPAMFEQLVETVLRGLT